MYAGKRGRANKRLLRGILGKPVHMLSEVEVDLVLDGIVNARPLRQRRLSAGELYRKAVALGADPCDLAEARGMP